MVSPPPLPIKRRNCARRNNVLLGANKDSLVYPSDQPGIEYLIYFFAYYQHRFEDLVKYDDIIYV